MEVVFALRPSHSINRLRVRLGENVGYAVGIPDDVDVVDVNIPMGLRIWMGTFAACFSTIVVITYSTPIFLVVMVPLSVLYFFIQVEL